MIIWILRFMIKSIKYLDQDFRDALTELANNSGKDKPTKNRY